MVLIEISKLIIYVSINFVLPRCLVSIRLKPTSIFSEISKNAIY